MPLNLYRRHRPDCEAGHPKDLRSGEWEERRKGWKRCDCLIHVSGTLGDKFNRRSTGRLSWEDARAYATRLETAGSWNGHVGAAVTSPAPLSVPDAAERITITDAIKVYLANRKATVAAPDVPQIPDLHEAASDVCGFVGLRDARPVPPWRH